MKVRPSVKPVVDQQDHKDYAAGNIRFCIEIEIFLAHVLFPPCSRKR